MEYVADRFTSISDLSLFTLLKHIYLGSLRTLSDFTQLSNSCQASC